MESEVKIIKFNPKDWNKYKKSLMELEKQCFEGQPFFMNEKEKKDCMTDKNAYCYLALDGDKIVSESYGNTLQTLDSETSFNGYWNPQTYSNYNSLTLYITSTATIPEYRNKGIAKKLKYEMLKDLEKDGYLYVIGHSHEGSMTRMNEFFNGKIIGEFKNWYGGKDTHYLCEIDLSEVPKLLPITSIKQLKEYDCGIASCCILAGCDKCIDLDIETPEYEKSFGLTQDYGISHEDLIDFHRLFFGEKLFSSYNANKSDIEDLINSGRFGIVNYQDDGEGHYSVIYGYDENFVYLLNVYTGKEEKIKYTEFEKNWYSKMYGFKWLAYKL